MKIEKYYEARKNDMEREKQQSDIKKDALISQLEQQIKNLKEKIKQKDCALK